MKTSWLRPTVRRPFRRSATLLMEQLEDRTLLDAANIFAAFTGALVTGETQDTVRVSLAANNFTIGGGNATLGFIVRPGPGSGLAPNPVHIDSVAPGNVPVITESVLDDGSSLVLAKLKNGDHDVRISGRNDTLGAWQLQVFLVGDVNGDFVVNNTDHNLINDVVNGTIHNPSFFAEADANRDGQITGFDLARASDNKGSATTLRVLAFDLSAGSDTGIVGDHTTTAGNVTLVGRTDPSETVTLQKAGATIATALASSTGTFLFANISLAMGGNVFTAHVMDVAGNVRDYELALTRIAPELNRQDVVLRWNQATLNAIRLDASPPPVATRALAMVGTAIFDAVSAIEGTPGYLVKLTPPTARRLKRPLRLPRTRSSRICIRPSRARLTRR